MIRHAKPARTGRRLLAFGSLALIVFVAIALGNLAAHDAQAVPGTGTLYATDASGGNLLTIDTVTGAGTIEGSMGVGPVPSLAIDPTTGIMYAGRGAGTPNIYTVDPGSGAATLVGNSGLGFAAIGGLDFRADAILYAAVNIVGDGGTGSDHLATINKAIGVATLIGPFGTCIGGSCTIDGMEGIAFDASGTLWGSLSGHGTGAPGLYTINTATGAATFFASIVDGSGAPPPGGVVSLQFECNGTLYGGTVGGRLITIDSTTGVFAFVGSVAATVGRSLGALALGGSSCDPTPTPTPCPGEGCPTPTNTRTPTPTRTPTTTPAPTPTLDFSIGVDTNGDGTLECTTRPGGPAKCNVAAGAGFKVSLFVDSRGGVAYVGFNALLAYAGVTGKGVPEPGGPPGNLDVMATYTWPDCAFPASLSQPGLAQFGCATGIAQPPSTYEGKLADVDFNCTASGAVDLVHGPDKTDLFDGDVLHNEAAGSQETLTINCQPALGGVADYPDVSGGRNIWPIALLLAAASVVALSGATIYARRRS